MYGLIDDVRAGSVREVTGQPRLRVGQLVRVVRDGDGPDGSCHSADIGSIGTIVEFKDGYYTRSDGWLFKEHELAPAFLPGDRVRVTKHAGYFAVGDEGEVERQDGNAVYVKHGSYQRIGLPIDADALELVEAAEAGNKEWLLKSGDGLFKVGRAGMFIRDPQPCIVARVVDGTPRPSNVPYVHASVQSAATEAERLARNTPGQEFAVYQRVTARVAEVHYEMKEVA